MRAAVKRFIEAETIYALIRKPWIAEKLAGRLEGLGQLEVRRVLSELMAYSSELIEKNAR